MLYKGEKKMIRQAIHAGSWYPGSKKDIEGFLDPGAKKIPAVGCVVPHAGWVYSGKTAGGVFSRMEPAKLYVLLGPNHTGMGVPVSVFPKGEWETPLGPLSVEENVARAIIENFPEAEEDTIAHRQEHSLEVQLPFLKYFSPEAKIVPIALADYRPPVMRALGEAIAKAVKDAGVSAVLVASSDMSHYISAAEAKKLDGLAIEKMLALDPEGLLETVSENDISMCGSGPAAAVMRAANLLGAKKASLVRYTNSGETTGDYDEVVGYAGILIS